MKIFVTNGSRSHLVEVNTTTTIEELVKLITKKKYYSFPFQFTLILRGVKISSGTIESNRINENECVRAVPTEISSMNLFFRTPEKKNISFEIMPTIKFSMIFDKFIQKSTYDPAKTCYGLNGKRIDIRKEFIDYFYFPSDNIFVLPITPSEDFLAYISLGNDLLMKIEIDNKSRISAVKDYVKEVYKIPPSCQKIFHLERQLSDDQYIIDIDRNAPVLYLTMELTGTLNTTVFINGRSHVISLNAYQTVNELKEQAFQKAGESGEGKQLSFDGIPCLGTEGLFSFHRFSPIFRVAGEPDPETSQRIETQLKPLEQNGDMVAAYIYSKVLLRGYGVPKDLRQGIQKLARAADLGHLNAMNDYGELFLTGVLSEAEAQAASTYAKRAADEGHLNSKFTYGMICKKKQQFSEGSRYLRAAADEGHVLAQTQYSKLVLSRRSDVDNYQQACEMLQKCYEKGHPNALTALARYNLTHDKVEEGKNQMATAVSLGSSSAHFNLSIDKFKNEENVQGLDLLKSAAKRRHLRARRCLSILKKRGIHVQKDVKAAFDEFTFLANRGDPVSMFFLAKFYLKGEIIGQDKEKAVSLLQKASSLKHIESKFLLANLKLRGIGCQYDPQEAFKLVKKCVQKGHIKAKRLLAILYYEGIGIGKSYDEAEKYLIAVHENDIQASYYYAMIIKKSPRANDQRDKIIQLLQKAADKKFMPAIEQLGFTYLETDRQEAMKYFRIASQAGLKESRFQLGVLMIEFGEDESTAASYIHDACEDCRPEAYYQFSILLEEGTGVPKDLTQSIVYLQKAADLGNSFAVYRVGLKLAESGEIEKGLEQLRKAADEGVVKAMTAIVGILVKTNGDKAEIEKYLALAAEKNDLDASYELGCYFESQKKFIEAYQHFERAMKGNRANGYYKCALLLEGGNGCLRNYEMAFQYIKTAAEMNFLPALFHYGRFLENGIGCNQDYYEAGRYYKISSDKNSSDGMVGLGRLLNDGHGIGKDENEAFALFSKAVQMGNIIAHFELAKQFESGRGCKVDNAKATEHFQYASEKNYGPAMVYYAKKLYFGIGIERNVENAKAFLMKGIKFDQKEAMFEYAEILMAENNEQEASDYYSLAAKRGHADSMISAGIILSKDDSTAHLAVAFFKQAAELKSPIGLNNYGLALATGNGCTRSPEDALKNFTLAANLGYVEANFNAGVLLMSTYTYIRDLQKAKDLFETAADKGHVPSMYNLATLLLNEEVQDTNKILKYLKIASDSGDVHSHFLYAHTLFVNAKNETDYKTAAEAANKGAEKEDPDSINLLGVINLNGKDKSGSTENAANYFKKSADLGSVEGSFNYGLLLSSDEYGQKNNEQAIEYMKKAQNLGHPLAESYLQLLSN